MLQKMPGVVRQLVAMGREDLKDDPRFTTNNPTPRGSSNSPTALSSSGPSLSSSTGFIATEVSGADVTSAAPHDEQKLTPVGLR